MGLNEKALLGWLHQNRPAVLTAVSYCCTDDEVRKTLNAVTGAKVAPEDDQEFAYALYLSALKQEPRANSSRAV